MSPSGQPLAEETRDGEPSEELRLVEALRAGDESAFAELIDQHGPAMLRVAQLHVRDREVAKEVVQETWIAVLQGIDRFEGRSSLRTWLFGILSNKAKTRGVREGRGVPFSALVAADASIGSASVDPDRFLGFDDSQWPYHWAVPPRTWPEERLLAEESTEMIGNAIAELPETQQEVIRLRDVAGWSSREVVESLEISDANQRVLLHRARSRVRGALESYFDPELGR
jgi:RNA polymerase sigma-70 factor (ECF subfamily)